VAKNLLDETKARREKWGKRSGGQNVIASAWGVIEKQFAPFGFTYFIKSKNSSEKSARTHGLVLRFAHGRAGGATHVAQTQCCSLMRRSAAP
jgi:hypothetical protein